ncbi:MAG TPA: FAD binding domain-containing protein [Gaiella sp.]|jgi:carbon-monoxide dehydrogenase medium subunit|nr:FAD binding domain-containing protein [Gaiella sp.]
MKPAPFGYVRAGSLDEALAALTEGGEDAKPIAGGQSLVPALNLRLVRPTLLVDLNHAGLDGVAANGALTVGATTRQAALVRDERVHPLVREALPFVGHFVTRNRGTVGGSIAHADGAAELPLCFVALDGKVVVDGPSGRRVIAADEFFVTHFTTALGAGELVVETVWPLVATGESCAFEELALRAGDFAQSMVAVALRRGADGRVVDASVAVGAVSDRPIRLRDVETLLVGTSGAEAARDAGSLAASLVDPPGSIHASARYLRALTGALMTRAIERAA